MSVPPGHAGSRGSTLRPRPCWLLAACLALFGCPEPAAAQTISQRGFVEASGFIFPQDTLNDTQNLVVDLVGREEAFLKPVPWAQFAAGFEARANTHDQVERSWRLDIADRGTLRPALSVRRLGATLTRGPVTIDVGKQFIRWGKADIVTPTDRFGPRDFLNVVDNEFLAVSGVRAVIQTRTDSLDGVWLPFFTPSRVPLVDQRWTAVPALAATLTLVDGGATIPRGSQAGVRWAHTGSAYETSLSYFDGFNHLPNIGSNVTPGASPADPIRVEVTRRYPDLRTYGADAAVPTPWFTIKGEAAWFVSPRADSDEYVLYVVQLERQTGEWSLVGGYAGEIVTEQRVAVAFAPDRGMTRSFVGRASYTVDANRSVALESAVRQNGRGVYVKGEYSQAHGQHWRATVTGALIRGKPDDFLGQYDHNSHFLLALRYSF